MKKVELAEVRKSKAFKWYFFWAKIRIKLYE